MAFSELSRRDFIAGLGAACTCCAAPQATAQTFPILCSWAGGTVGSGLSQASPLARNIVTNVMGVIGYKSNMTVYRGGVPNAAATVINNQLAIVYNPGFLNQLTGCNPAAAVSVLAHEVGHHANADTTWAAIHKHSWTKELGADWVSGLAMKRMGISLKNALSGIVCSFGVFSPGSPSHPGSQQRLKAIRAGWLVG